LFALELDTEIQAGGIARKMIRQFHFLDEV
jgi:hypothetical protein